MTFWRILLVCVAVFGGHGLAVAQPSSGSQTAAAAPATFDLKALRASLDQSRGEIEQTEASLRRPDISSDALQGVRMRIEPVADRLRGEIAELGPRLDAARARLEQLGPKPKDGAPAEGPDVAKDRADREAGVSELDEVNRLARAMLLQAEQLTSQISDRRRAAFTSALFQRSYSVLSPDLWVTVMAALPRDLRAVQLLVGDAVGRASDRTSPLILTLLGLALGIGIALYLVRNRVAPRLVHRDPDAVGIEPPRKLATAFGILVFETLPAAAGSLLIYEAIVLLDVLPYRLLPVAAALLRGLAFVAFIQGLIDALFAPDRPAWRIVTLPDRAASAVRNLGVAFGILVVASSILDALNQAIAAGLALSVACKAVMAVAASVALAELLRRLSVVEERDEVCLGPFIATEAPVGGPIRMLGWALTGLVLVGTVGGYVAFSSFLLDQIVWVASLGGLLYLLVKTSDIFIGGTLAADEGRLSTTLQTNLGLRQHSLRQIGVLVSGVGRIVLIVVALMLALAPWGIESGDLAANLRAAFFGFKVGDVTISLSTTILAILVFVGTVFATRIVQGWLTNTFLPTTNLDSGLRNSITTAAGYVGFFVAAAFAFTYLGLSLEKMAIVAGALSVGIGFGLQSIVNNFVSGLILLWERPIRVGDLVVVGSDGEGFVRRISVRATEIETFDRSTVIVPNSSLISGTVRNRMRGDTTGRVLMPIQVLRNQDPARAAELLIAQATAHADVLQEPGPRVLFRKIGETWLDLDLICFVEDVTKQARVQSDLNFSVFKALVDEGILPPLGPGAMNVGGLEPVQSALQQIADAIARERLRPAQEGSPAAKAEPAENPPAAIRRRAGRSS